MSRLVPGRSVLRLAVAAFMVATLAIGGIAVPDAGAASLPRWTGSVDLYRQGAFTTQQSWLWCTAADVQIMRNLVEDAADHSTANQQRYFDYMRAHNRYDIPEKHGVDPVGWAAGLRHYVDDRYEMLASRTFDAALRDSVTNLRRTNLPVGITVGHGSHAWVITGFSASADPAVTDEFTVTSVRVVGPLWGLQSRDYGYDMKPGTKLSVKQLKTFFTPWHYDGIRMTWEDHYVSVQPVAGAEAAATVAPTPEPKPTPTPTPTPTPIPTPTPTSPTPTSPASPDTVAIVRPTASAGAPGPSDAPGSTDGSRAGAEVPWTGILAVALGIAAASLVLAAWRSRMRARPR